MSGWKSDLLNERQNTRVRTKGEAKIKRRRNKVEGERLLPLPPRLICIHLVSGREEKRKGAFSISFLFRAFRSLEGKVFLLYILI